MNPIPSIPRHRARNGGLALFFVAVLLGSLVLAAHSPAHDEGVATSAKPSAGSAKPAHFDPNFVYFPSQYELHAGPPEEHIEAF